ncbi:MAG TPA: hypothetical protein EYP88_03005, partial [Anaerolineales bacterium]|nr:hypothetical protein [Anaerolineales bacterium]
MSKKSLSRFLSLFMLLSMMLGMVAPAGALASAPEATLSQEDALAKIEPLVLTQIESEGQTDFFVWMVEKADLSPAYELETKEEKGQFVFDALRETAARTQAALRDELDKSGVEYRPYYIANKILVRGGNQALLMDIAARPDVAEITANHKFQLQEPIKSPAGPSPLAVETNISFINADDVWAMGYDGSGIVLAGNDTGLDDDHPTISPHYRGCQDPPTCSVVDHNYNWWDASGESPSEPYDGHGHGTHTTGTMVGDDGGTNQIGVAPGAQTIHCSNMTASGNGSDATFTECFEWDLAPWDLSYTGPGTGNPDPAMAPDAINNSWGYWGGGADQFRDEIQALHAAGILVEVSAGNEGSNCSTLRSPGDYQEVLTTGSVNHASGTLPGTISGFSSRGPSSLDGNYFPDIMAPGENIRSALPGNSYGSWGGTSMAGPHATALIGLMWSACPAFQGDVNGTIDIIRQTAVPLTGQNGSNCGGDYTTGPNNDWGMGTIDAEAAVNMILSLCSGQGNLDGTVTDSSTTNPIENVTVTAARDAGGSWSQDTDVTGYYTMTIPNGVYTVTASHPMYVDAEVTGVVVVTGTLTTQNFALTPMGMLYGYVTDYDNGFGLEATVTADDGTTTTSNPSTGYYEMYLDPGTYTVTASVPDYAAETVTVTISSGVNTQQDFALQAAIAFVPSPVHVTLDMGAMYTTPVTLTNRMATPYDFQFYEVPGGFAPTALGGVLDAGGPDPYGYTFTDSDEAGGPAFDWIEISGTGLDLGQSDDDYYWPIDLPFTFNFYGTDITQLAVGSNGTVYFEDAYMGFVNAPIPGSNNYGVNAFIAGYWDDLNPSAGGAVYYETVNYKGVDLAVVEWYQVPHYGTSDPVTYEVILFPNGSILLQYLDPSTEAGSGATVGIQGDTSTGLQYSYNTASLAADL